MESRRLHAMRHAWRVLAKRSAMSVSVRRAEAVLRALSLFLIGWEVPGITSSLEDARIRIL